METSQYILVALVLLACPVGMGLMLWYMQRYERRSRAGLQISTTSGPSATPDEVARLHAEVHRLKAALRASQQPSGPPPRIP
ncbi:hypothetical protein JOF29_000111 [Kribbella aluminosa]|uniref:Phage shock protein B n=1 Tax=Kribbella aluminosa TaxID=416017 RepID=A0ABS4UBP7_9ACTN|nr:hypothetical protein [Kribbella aluminosa]MBP2349028.1 hypothetical protein [Kribbella aluminosa]